MLVPRLATSTAGRVTIDGHDVRDAHAWSSLRSAVATAFEEPILFSASVRENVTLGHPDATDDEVEQALALAQADFVHDLPWGLDTRVGEQGMSLSGGQRQRLALARAVIGRPRCWCSTTRCPRWTSRPSTSSSRRCAGCWPPPRRSSSCTGPAPSRSPTASRCCTTAGSAPSARTPS